jgi:3-phosphoshikimate 1-carboxyvinyltransferase
MLNISKSNRQIRGEITLDGSKSISNRVLIIRALCSERFNINNLSTSKDTQTLLQLLEHTEGNIYDAGPAGTTFRFLTAYLAMKEGTQIMTGSERMKQRPIGNLVEALRKLGANIEYLEKEGYPPLKIDSPNKIAVNHQLSIPANVSSQFITALLLIAPSLPNGLELTLEGNIVSRSYIEMTLAQMAYFGIIATWEGNTIRVEAQPYQAQETTVEADWSAASYYYALAAFADDDLDLQLNGLYANSTQGDSALIEMMPSFGIQTIFNETGIHLSKKGEIQPFFEWDFIRCPDIAQTLAVICAGLGVQGLFTGLETLRIKETDRILALQNELGKMQVWLSKLPARFSKKHPEKEYYMTEGKAVFAEVLTFPTYEDHRMAMAFAPLALFSSINIEEPNVVVKSYPQFWEDLKILGFIISLKT